MLFTEEQKPISLPKRIRGSGGGGGKGSVADNDANSLRSKATFNMVEVISEGEIVGLVDGEKSIFFDETAVLNDDGSYNYENIEWEEHVGLADEGYFNGFDAVESTVSVETQVKRSVGPVVRTIVDEEVDALRVIIRIPSLVFQDDDGVLRTTSVSYAIDVRSYEGTWTEVLQNDLTNEKCLSPAQISHEIDLPQGGAPWDVRVRRVTEDSTVDELQNDTYWEGYVKLVKGKFIYPHCAALAIRGNAEDMGTSVPPRAYHIKGLIVRVPSNYDAETRTYSGIWDGTWKLSWTNNPAWIFLDLLTNDRYGLGEFIDVSTVDKWSLYTIAQYCDQNVKSGYKNGDTGEDIYEPRFTFNGVINSRDEAYYVLQTITKAWRGMGYWALGQVFATADMPADPVTLVSPANVIGGQFDYQSTARKARHSVVMIKWNNPDDFYHPDTEVVIDTKLLHKYGWNEKSLTLAGCTSRGLAHRYGKWIIDTEQNETETVTYTASWDHAQLRPGDLIAISDPAKAQIRAAGRVVKHDNEALKVYLDAAFDATEGETYQIVLTMPTGEVVTKPIISFSDDKTTVNVADAFDLEAKPDAMWTIKGNDINPRQYRVITIDEEEETKFKVTALFHDPQKFARVEEGIALEPITYNRPSNKSEPPINLKVTETGYVSNGTQHQSLTVSWTAPDILCRGFIVDVDTPTGEGFSLGETQLSNLEMKDTGEGVYKFYVRTIAYAGAVSKAATIEYEANGITGFALPTVTNLALIDDPDSNEFTGKDVRVQWENNFATVAGGPVQHVSSPFYDHNIVRVYNNADATLLRTARTKTEEYIYDFATNLADNKKLGNDNAARSVRIEVEVYDTFGRNSNAISKVFTNPAPKTLTPNHSIAGNTIFLGYADVTDQDYAGTLIFRSETIGAINVETDTPLYNGKNNPLTIDGDYDTTYYFKMAAFDVFGKGDLNWTSEFSITTLGDGADIDAPEVPTGLSVTSSLVNGRVRVVATWDESTATDLAGYDLQVKQGTGNYVTFQLASNAYEFDALPNTVYFFKVRARDVNANESGYSDEVSITSAKDTTPPGDVTNVSISSGLTSIWLDWVNPGDEDLAFVEIWEGSSNVRADATIIERAAGNTLARTGLPNQAKRFYWLRPVDTSGNAGNFTNVVSSTTAEVPDSKRITTSGLLLTPNSPSANKVSWPSCTVSVGKPGSAPVTKTITAGSATWTSGTLFLFYVEGETTFRTTTTLSTIYTSNGYPLATYKGGTKVDLTGGKTIVSGDQIISGSVGADQLVSNSAIITGQAQIKDAIVTDAKIVSLSAAKLKANTILSDTILVGGDTLSTIRSRAANPAGTVNNGSTLIDPGKVLIAGGTSLADWRNGDNSTEINGGSIATNTIKANSLSIGSRGIYVEGITFEHNSPSANYVSWTAGAIGHISDGGSVIRRSISASNAKWTSGVLYLYWEKATTLIKATNDFSVANTNDTVVLATYKGGDNLVSTYGRTVIDGGLIKTQSIQADQIAANAITATQLAADSVTANAIKVTNLAAISANLGNITGGSLNINNKFKVDASGNVTIKSGTSGARLELSNSLVKVYDANGTLRVRLGIW